MSLLEVRNTNELFEHILNNNEYRDWLVDINLKS